MDLFKELGVALDPSGKIENESNAEKLGRMTVRYELAEKQRARLEAECDRLRDIIIKNDLEDQLF